MARPDDADPAAESPASATPAAPPTGPVPAAPTRRRWSRTPLQFQLSVGSTVSRTFSIWLKGLVPFAVLSLAVHAPLIVGMYYFTLARENVPWVQDAAKFSRSIDFITSAVFEWILTGAVAFAVFQRLRGQPAPFVESVSHGFRSGLRVLGTGLTVCIVTTLGFLLIIPGVIATCTFIAAVPAAVVERTGVRASMSRSSALARGHRGAIFGALFVTRLFATVVAVVMFRVVGLEAATTYQDLAIRVAMVEGFAALIVPLSSILACVVYHDLRIGKEGASADEIAAVFD